MKRTISVLVTAVLMLLCVLPAGAAQEEREAVSRTVLAFLEDYTINHIHYGTNDLSGYLLPQDADASPFLKTAEVNQGFSAFTVDKNIKAYLEKKIADSQEIMRADNTVRENLRISFSDIKMAAAGDIALAQLQVFIEFHYPGAAYDSAMMPRYLLSLVKTGGKWIVADVISDDPIDRGNGKHYTEPDNLEGPEPPENDLPLIYDYTDVQGHWAYTYINNVLEDGYFNGTSPTTFSPNESMSRGMFVTVLGRMANADLSSNSPSPFSDVRAGAYYAPYVNWAVQKGIVKGVSPKLFKPDDSVTREQIILMLSRFLARDEFDPLGQFPCEVDSDTPNFQDIDKTSAEFKNNYLAFYQASIIEGRSPTSFAPHSFITRAEAAKIFALTGRMLAGDVKFYGDAAMTFTVPWYWLDRVSSWPMGDNFAFGRDPDTSFHAKSFWESYERNDRDVDGYTGLLFSFYFVEDAEGNMASFKNADGSWKAGFSFFANARATNWLNPETMAEETRDFVIVLHKPVVPNFEPGDALGEKLYKRLEKDVTRVIESVEFDQNITILP